MMKKNLIQILLINLLWMTAGCEKKNEEALPPTTTLPGRVKRMINLQAPENFQPNSDLNKTKSGRVYTDSSPLQWDGVSVGVWCQELGKGSKEKTGSAKALSSSQESQTHILEGGEKGGTLYLKEMAGRTIDELHIALNGQQKYFEVRYYIPKNKDCALRASLPANAKILIHSENYELEFPDSVLAKTCRSMQTKNEDKHILLECDCPFESSAYIKSGWSRSSSAGKNCYSKHAIVEDSSLKF